MKSQTNHGRSNRTALLARFIVGCVLALLASLSMVLGGCSKCTDAVEGVRENMTRAEVRALLGEPDRITQSSGFMGAPGTENWIWLRDCGGGIGYSVHFLSADWVAPNGNRYRGGLVTGWGRIRKGEDLG